MAGISVCFPYRPDGGPRDLRRDWVLERYRALLPDAELCLGEPDSDKPFSRSQALNAAYRASHGDVIIAADLDVVFDPDGIQEAVERVRHDDDSWGYSFTRFFATTAETAAIILQQSPTTPIADFDVTEENSEAWSDETASGNVVISRRNYERVGGFDEGFVGWGYEDMAFELTADSVLSPHFRIPGKRVIHIWHPRPEGVAEVIALHTANADYYQAKYLR